MKFVDALKVFLVGGLGFMALWVPMIAYTAGSQAVQIDSLSNEVFLLEKRIMLLERPIGPRSVPAPIGRGPNIGEAPPVSSASP